MNRIGLPTNAGWYVEWETGKTYTFHGKEFPRKDSFESRDKARIDQKIEELKEAGYKITATGDCFF